MLDCIEELGMARKSFEIKNQKEESLLKNIDFFTGLLFDKFAGLYQEGKRNERMDRFWAREWALAEHGFAEGYDYCEFLPGRHYTYKRLSNILDEYVDLKNKKVVELGSGSGLGLTFIGSQGSHVTAFDRSWVALNFFAYLAKRSGVKRFSMVQGNFYNTGFGDNEFDCCFNLGVFEHLEEERQKELAKEMGRITRNLVLIAVPNPASPQFKTLKQNEMEFSEEGEYIYPDRKMEFEVDLPKLMKSAGLNLLREDGLAIAPSSQILPHHLDKKTLEFFGRIPSVKPQGEGKERVKNLLGYWECVEKSLTKEERLKYCWFKYAIGSKE